MAGRQTWQRIFYYLTHATYKMWGDVLDARRLQSNREAWSKRSTAGLPADIEDQAVAVPCISPRNIYQRQLMLLPSFKSACNCLLPFSHARQALNIVCTIKNPHKRRHSRWKLSQELKKGKYLLHSLQSTHVWKWPVVKYKHIKIKPRICVLFILCLTWTVNANSLKQNIIVIQEICSS